jgi:hypothetical protein
VVAKAAVHVVILAVPICGNRSAHRAAGGIQLDPIKGRQLDHSTVFELSGITIGAAEAPCDQ